MLCTDGDSLWMLPVPGRIRSSCPVTRSSNELDVRHRQAALALFVATPIAETTHLTQHLPERVWSPVCLPQPPALPAVGRAQPTTARPSRPYGMLHLNVPLAWPRNIAPMTP